MTEFVLHDAMGSETNYNNLIVGSLGVDFFHTDATVLKLVDSVGNSVSIFGQNLTYSGAGITGGSVLSVEVANSSAVSLLTIDQLPLNSPAATFYQDFAAHGLASLFTSLNTGADTFTGNAFANTLRAGAGSDTINGNGGVDHLFGQVGADSIDGGGARDFLYGGIGNDTVLGGSGNDYISGDVGNDSLTGGIGYDQFVFRAGDGHDTITDFRANSTDVGHLQQDHIVVTPEMLGHFEKHLVKDAVTHVVLGTEVDFFNAAHVAQGSIFLQHVLAAAITASDFTLG